MRKSILASCVLLLSLASYAGNERGNGGDVVVCQNQNGKITNIQMLDLYEAWQLRGQLPKLGGENLNFDEKVSLLISRIEKQNVGISQIIKSEIERFPRRAYHLSDVILNDIPDSDHLYVLKGCEIQQIAIQGHILGQGPHDDEPRDILINQELYNQLDDDNRLALVLHEVLYTFAIKRGHTNSKKVRILVSGLISKDFENMSDNTAKKEFKKLISETMIFDI